MVPITELGRIKLHHLERLLDTTSALNTKIVRIWAGNVGSAHATPEHRAAIVDEIARCCDLAASRGVSVAMEFYGGTLSDNVDPALALIEALNRSNFGTFWQPLVAMEPMRVLEGFRRVLPHVLNIPPGRKVPCGESSMWGDYHAIELAVYLKRLIEGGPYLTFFDPKA